MSAKDYSQTPLSRKLGAKPGAGVVVFFTTTKSELERRFGRLKAILDPADGLWIAWPKRSSGVDTDLTEDVVRELALGSLLVDNKVCAIDDTWSGLRLVIRLRDRP